METQGSRRKKRGERRRHKEKKQGPKKEEEESSCPLLIESDEVFAYIAGYTSGGAPYGVTWEEAEGMSGWHTEAWLSSYPRIGAENHGSRTAMLRSSRSPIVRRHLHG